MNLLNPIHTEKRQCQDCYKCVRNCPVKAIKVEGGCATVIVEACILCGQCVAVCPNSAKKVRDDVTRARHLLASNPKVIVSLAPSFVAAFPDVGPRQMAAAIKRLGFADVSETALGAQQVSTHVAELLKHQQQSTLISSACPTIVAYLQKHRPLEAKKLTPLLSPLLAHCKMLRQRYGAPIGVVFFGPCIAKKSEADSHPELLDIALTFDDLRQWFEVAQINPAAIEPGPDDHFVPNAATDGALYPVDGGMIAGIKAGCGACDAAFMAFSGLSSVQKAIADLDALLPDGNLMIEALACEGGCVNGPAMGNKASTTRKRYQVLRYGKLDPSGPRPVEFPIAISLTATPVLLPHYPENQIREALRLVGKQSAEDELNCGGCGYDSCREFARAVLGHKAEPSMCVTYMRQLAHKKADALIQKMPSAVVIVNQHLRVVEYNRSFATLFASANMPDGAKPLEGTDLAELLPFSRLFRGVLASGQDIVDRDLRFRETILHLSIFTIEKNVLVGGIIQDITKPAVQKEQVIRKAREVIQNSLSTVQKIAYLLGENAAESEITLNSIIESFTVQEIEEKASEGEAQRGGDHDWRKRYRR